MSMFLVFKLSIHSTPHKNLVLSRLKGQTLRSNVPPYVAENPFVLVITKLMTIKKHRYSWNKNLRLLALSVLHVVSGKLLLTL